MELFDYQSEIVDKAVKHLQPDTDNKMFNLFLQMGLGKTVIALEITKRLNCKQLLIVCPKSLIEMWVYNVNKLLSGFARMETPEDLTTCTWKSFCVVNYEYFRSKSKSEVFAKIQPDCCIFDEAHKIKNVNSLLHKCISASISATYTLNLTGTPITKDYMDLFGILTITGEQRFMCYTAAQFRARYITNGGSTRTQELMQRIEPYSVFGDIDEYVDMPEAHNIVIPVVLSMTQYAELDIIYKSNRLALARIMKAQQITSGIDIDQSTPKVKACIQLINDITADNEKVVLFCKFDKEFDFFMDYYKNIAVGINGKTKDRETPVFEFQNNPKIKLFIGNLQTAGVGITLTAASKCIFYSQTYTWGDAEQSKARIYRIGQKNNCIYYYLLGVDTVDEVIYKSNVYKTNLIEDFKQRYGGI